LLIKLNFNTAETFKQNRIVFFGTPDFAVASLDALLKSGANIVAIVTSVDKPYPSAVKKYALDKGIPILQPISMKSPGFIEELKSYKADIQLVVAFRMMPEIVWNMPPMGTINLHGSLLPKYRGAAPINWAIINGEKETGVTTFKLKHAIDTGDILLQDRITILPEDNAETIHDKLMYLGANLLVETVKGVFNGTLKEKPQELTEITYAPKLFKNNTIVDWNNSCQYINNFVRGLNPYPTSWINIKGINYKVYKTSIFIEKHEKKIGEYETDNKKYLRFVCNDGYIYVNEIQMDGKKRMDIKSFLNGYKFI
jgi:methionyl-tRNA formyltransferase